MVEIQKLLLETLELQLQDLDEARELEAGRMAMEEEDQ